MGSQPNYTRRKLPKVILPPLQEPSEWRDYRLEDLFTIGTGSILSKDMLLEGNIPRISAKSENNGIIGYYDTKKNMAARHFENFISVNFFGSSGGIFYHPYKASLEMKVHALQPKGFVLDRSTGIYFVTALLSILNGYTYGNQLSSSKLKSENFVLKLPSKDNQLDFQYMAYYVQQIEA
ncbi:restriction endonuclease subunit S, partial [Enterococcus sp. 7E2_DIV0204]|uniref:restriction endonuclease subunit S n=1 Tax=Enterococcus sp. 7E2_DIV0204 TaxID=1834188 RepID=UPI001593C749